ncbi:MAG: aminoglycoside phosphotransferase family protein [Smithellaceae bacterium]
MDKETREFLADHLGAVEFNLLAIKKGGSDRNFFRVLLPDQSSFIFMHYGTDVAENSCWVDINKFLAGIGVCVPQIIAQDPGLHFILLEDLGDIDLWSQRALPWRERREYYYRVLRQIRKLHAFDPALLPSGLQLSEGYSEQLYRWEQNYFLENFVGAVCHLEMSLALQKALERELAGLIARLQKIEPSLIHRDLQSQNILLKNGRPVLIDFQGIRKGCLFYDLGSLICDPYVTFNDNERRELLTFYYDLMKPDYSRDEFSNNFREAAVQRLMQALGAYGFLGLKKNKPDFLKHIDNGIKNLLTAAASVETLPVLRELAGLCIQKLAKD